MQGKTAEDKIKDRDQAIVDARNIISQQYCVIDTETTGLNNSQMCQIGILYSNGKQFKSFVKPTIPIELGAMNVHHITEEMVKDAPDARSLLKHFPNTGLIVIYNAPFDTKVIRQSLSAQSAAWIYPEEVVIDAMQIYSKFAGVWNDYYMNYKWHRLEVACNQCGIEIDVELHDALSDCIMTDKLIKYIAAQKLSTE